MRAESGYSACCYALPSVSFSVCNDISPSFNTETNYQNFASLFIRNLYFSVIVFTSVNIFPAATHLTKSE
jgi:hypothetical protein